jgi:hypothetical protein
MKLNRSPIHSRPVRRRGRRPDVLTRLSELLDWEHPDDPAWSAEEDERLTQARLALFGSAPK